MASVEAFEASDVSAPILSRLPSLIGSLGDNSFGRKLITFLNETCGAEHCTLFKFSKQTPFEVVALSRDGTDTAHRQFQLYLAGSYWRGDPTMTEALRLVGSFGHSMQRTAFTIVRTSASEFCCAAARLTPRLASAFCVLKRKVSPAIMSCPRWGRCHRR
jgi:hypothetical protein